MPLVPDHHAVAVEMEDLHAIAAAVDEQEQMTRQEVLAKALLDQSGQAIKRWRFMVTSARW